MLGFAFTVFACPHRLEFDQAHRGRQRAEMNINGR
jgi:hypothetical protein